MGSESSRFKVIDLNKKLSSQQILKKHKSSFLSEINHVTGTEFFRFILIKKEKVMSNMSIKMVAVDMDGTFLNDKKEYNVDRFIKLFQKMQENDVKFVVASGNQYDQLKSFFPEYHKEMSFVSENGANIIVEGNYFYNAKIKIDKVIEVLKAIEKLNPTAIVLCGKKSAYVSRNMSDETFKSVSFYYPSIKTLNRLEEIAQEDDEIFKFALSFPPFNIEVILERLADILDGEMIPVSSGHGDIDLIIPGVHKAYGLSKLSDMWNIHPSEIAAFGDSGNDIEMLKFVGSSFAMDNAQEEVKKAANGIIGSNNSESLLDVIELLNDNHS